MEPRKIANPNEIHLNQVLALLPKPVATVVERAMDLGKGLNVQLYAVGGFVRDLLLGIPAQEVDMVMETSAIPFTQALSEGLAMPFQAYPQFHTATLTLPEGYTIDFVTARGEVYPAPGALPQVYPSTLEVDLARRDFTINAMALQLNQGTPCTLIDPLGGLRDLEGGILRVLHGRSFWEDPTRIIRGLRFAARLSLALESETAAMLQEALEHKALNHLSGDRLRDAFQQIFQERDYKASLREMEAWGVLQALHPQFHIDNLLLEKIPELNQCNGVDFCALSPWEQRLVVLLLLVKGVPLEERMHLLERLISLGSLREGIGRLLETQLALYGQLAAGEISNSALYQALVKVELPLIHYLYFDTESSMIRSRLIYYLRRLREVKPSITGKDLIALGIAPGPRYREILWDVLMEKLEGRVANREEELAYVLNTYFKREDEQHELL